MKKKLDTKKEITKVDELFALSIRKLKNSDCSIEKMREFLKKKDASEEEINEVIIKLLKYSIINEDEMVKSIISFCDYKHYGYNKLIYILESRKISKNRIDKVVKNEEREIRHAKELLMDILSEDLTENEVVDILGHDIQNRNAYNVMLAKMHQVATKGNVKAFEALRDTVGDKPTEEVNISANVITDNERQLLNILGENMAKMGLNPDK